MQRKTGPGMIPRGVRAVVFDAVGTVIHPDPPAAEVYVEVGRRFGSRLGMADIVGRFAAAFRAVCGRRYVLVLGPTGAREEDDEQESVCGKPPILDHRG